MEKESNRDMNTKDIKKIIRKFRIWNNTLIAVQGDPSDESTVSFVNELVRTLNESRLQGVVVIIVKDVNDINVFDEPTMNKLGWFRRDQISSLLAKITMDALKQQKKAEAQPNNAGETESENASGQT